MADGLLGGITNIVGGTITPALQQALEGLPQQVGDLLTGSTGHVMDDIHLQPLVEGLQVDVSTPGGEAATAPVDATAEPAPFTLPAGADWSELFNHVERFGDKLESLQSDASAKMASPDPNEQAAGQLLMQQSQALMETVQSVLQQMSDTSKDAIQNLHSNADGLHDTEGTVVAMADSGDGHVVGHVDQDASTDHQVDHVSAPPAAHDDGAAVDPSTAA